MPADNPLTPDHLGYINGVMKSIPPAMDLVAKCENCGIPVQDIKDQLAAQAEMARRLKANFFPHET